MQCNLGVISEVGNEGSVRTGSRKGGIEGGLLQGVQHISSDDTTLSKI